MAAAIHTLSAGEIVAAVAARKLGSAEVAEAFLDQVAPSRIRGSGPPHSPTGCFDEIGLRTRQRRRDHQVKSGAIEMARLRLRRRARRNH